MTDDELTRRRLLAMGVVLPLGLVACGDDGSGSPAALAKTPSCDDGDETPEQTEGPYFIPGSPRRRNLRAGGLEGRALLITRTRRAASGSRRWCRACIRAARATSTSRCSRAAARCSRPSSISRARRATAATGIFDAALLMRVSGRRAHYDFVV